MLNKIWNWIADLAAGFYIITAAIGVVVVAAIYGTAATIVAAIVAVLAILLKLFTTFLSKTEDRIASIYLWSYRTLENLRHLFEFLKAESFFKEKETPPEAETKWQKMKDSIFDWGDKFINALGHGFIETQRGKRGTVEGIRKYIKKREKNQGDSKEFEKSLNGEAYLKTGSSILDSIFKLYEKVCDIDSTLQSKDEVSKGDQAGKFDGSELDVDNASWEKQAETPAEGDPVITRLDNLAAQVAGIATSLETKDEKAPADDSLTEIKEALMRIEGALGLSDIAAALEEIRTGLQSLIQPEGEEGTTAGENAGITEANPADNEVKIGEKIDDLGVDVRDSKRSLQFDINEVKAKLDRLIKVIEEKAMTFNDIYDKLCIRMVREHRNATGRTIGR